MRTSTFSVPSTGTVCWLHPVLVIGILHLHNPVLVGLECEELDEESVHVGVLLQILELVPVARARRGSSSSNTDEAGPSVLLPPTGWPRDRAAAAAAVARGCTSAIRVDLPPMGAGGMFALRIAGMERGGGAPGKRVHEFLCFPGLMQVRHHHQGKQLFGILTHTP